MYGPVPCVTATVALPLALPQVAVVLEPDNDITHWQAGIPDKVDITLELPALSITLNGNVPGGVAVAPVVNVV